MRGDSDAAEPTLLLLHLCRVDDILFPFEGVALRIEVVGKIIKLCRKRFYLLVFPDDIMTVRKKKVKGFKNGYRLLN